jgi:hypothetical protein
MPLVNKNRGPIPNIIGKKVSEAQPIVETAGYVFRISNINGRGMMLTTDGRSDRINVSIQGEGDPYKDWKIVDGYVVVAQAIG